MPARCREWYKKDSPMAGPFWPSPSVSAPKPERRPHFSGRPARREMIRGEVQGQELSQYDFTPWQYRALAKLTATLCTVLPRITCDYPRDAAGQLITRKLPGDQLQDYHGVLGHYHIQTNKVDPGPALQWDYVIGRARRLMGLPPVPPWTANSAPTRRG